MPAPYTTIAEVKKIIEVPTALTDEKLTAFLTDATLVVTEDLEGRGMSQDRLALIAKYLTAHYVTILVERGGLTSSSVDDAAETYGGPKGATGLAMTRFGQQAIAFDTTGTLKAMATRPGSKNLNAQFRVM